MRKTVLSMLATFACLSSVAQAPVTITFNEAMQMALSRNEAILAHDHEQKAAEHERKAAFGMRLPEISVQGAYSYMSDDIGVDVNKLKPAVQRGLDYLNNTGLVPPEVQSVASTIMRLDWGLTLQEREFAFAGANLTFPIFMGGKLNVANEAAKINEQNVAIQGEAVRNEVVSQLVERYYGLFVAKLALGVRQQVVDDVAKHLYDARQLEKNGVIARGERLLVEVRMSEAERNLKAATTQISTISSALCNALNDERDFIPVSNLFMLDNIQPLEYYQDLAVSNSPLLRQVGLQRELAQQGVCLQISEMLPQIALLGSYRFAEYQVSPSLPKWMIGAGASITLFNGLSKEHKLSASKQVVSQVGLLEDKAAKDIRILVEKLYNGMKDLRETVVSIDASLDFAKEYLRIREAGFREGVSGATELMDAELNLASIRIERLQAAYMYDLTLARLLETCGISERFAEYATGDNSVPVLFKK